MAYTDPDIVCIVTDDEPKGPRYIDYMPETRALFEEFGVTCPNAFAVSPLCGPSRANSLQGRPSHKTRVTRNDFSMLDPTVTIATALTARGYATALVGKYLNGYCDCIDIPECILVPPGWGYWFGAGDAEYFDWVGRFAPWGHDSSTAREEHAQRDTNAPGTDYATDVLKFKALDAIATADPTRPLMLWLAPFCPHEPAIPADRHKNAACGPASFQPPNWGFATDKPQWVMDYPAPNQPEDLRAECRTMKALDEAIVAIKAAMVAAGRTNCVYVYFCDNGRFHGEHKLGHKSGHYMAASGIPLYFAWDQIPGTPFEMDDVIGTIDIPTTLVDIAGGALAGTQGVSAKAKLLAGGVGPPLRPDLPMEMLMPQHNPEVRQWAAVHTNDGKRFVRTLVTGETELYDYADDEFELDNRHDEPDDAVEMAVMSARLDELIGDVALRIMADGQSHSGHLENDAQSSSAVVPVENRDIPAGRDAFMVVFADGVATIAPAVDSKGNVWTPVEPQLLAASLGMAFLHCRPTTTLVEDTDTVPIAFSAPVSNRRCYLYQYLHVAAEEPVLGISLPRTGQSRLPVSDLLSLPTPGVLGLVACSYAIGGGKFKHGAGCAEKDFYAGTGKHVAVQDFVGWEAGGMIGRGTLENVANWRMAVLLVKQEGAEVPDPEPPPEFEIRRPRATLVDAGPLAVMRG